MEPKFMIPGIGLAFWWMTSLGELHKKKHLSANAEFLLVKLKLFAGQVYIVFRFRSTIPHLKLLFLLNVFMAMILGPRGNLRQSILGAKR